jgi:hypothetical protein
MQACKRQRTNSASRTLVEIIAAKLYIITKYILFTKYFLSYYDIFFGFLSGISKFSGILESDSLMKQFKTLKGKLVFAGVMALLVTVVVNLGIGVFLSYQGMEKNVEKDLKSIGQTAQVAVTNSTNLMKEKIQFIGSSSEIGGTAASGKSWITSLESKKESYGYKMLYVADRNGKITSSNADYNGKSVESTEYFKQAMNGKITISTPMKDIAGNLAVFAAAPVSNQKYTGVVVGEMDAQTYSNGGRKRRGKRGALFSGIRNAKPGAAVPAPFRNGGSRPEAGINARFAILPRSRPGRAANFNTEARKSAFATLFRASFCLWTLRTIRRRCA